MKKANQPPSGPQRPAGTGGRLDHELGVEAAPARREARGQVPVRGLLPGARSGMHQEMVSAPQTDGKRTARRGWGLERL